MGGLADLGIFPGLFPRVRAYLARTEMGGAVASVRALIVRF